MHSVVEVGGQKPPRWRRYSSRSAASRWARSAYSLRTESPSRLMRWAPSTMRSPVLFDDHDRAAGEQLRESVVQPAQRSPAAHRKAASKRTDDDLPVHSFRSLMSELGTLTANRVRMVDSGATFTMHSEPTKLQQRCFDLLEVSAQV